MALRFGAEHQPRGLPQQALGVRVVGQMGFHLRSRRTAQLPHQIEPHHAEIRIRDNGIGLPEDRVRLFEPYVTTREKGTGLGLPIVKKIIEEHGGTLKLKDAPPLDDTGQIGAEAEIRLPVLNSE